VFGVPKKRPESVFLAKIPRKNKREFSNGAFVVLIGRRKRSMSVSFSRNPNRYVRTVCLFIPAKESRRFVSSPLPLPETPESVERPEFTKKSTIHLLRKSKTIPQKKWISNHPFL
jgi:hypothetical protein